MVHYQILVSTIHGKIKRIHIKAISLKISAPTWNDELELSFKHHEILTDYPPIQIYIHKIVNRTIFKIKSDVISSF